MICLRKMLATIRSKRDTKCSLQRMQAELLQNAEKSERRIGEIRARKNLLEKQVEEWCAESQESETVNVTDIEPRRFINVQSS